MPRPPNRKVTLKDVALEAGVSSQLVSGVFGGKTSTIRYTEATRERVLEAAKKLGFRPDIRARGLRAGRSFLVGVMVHTHSWQQTDFLRGLQKNLEEADITPLMLTHATPEEEVHHLRVLLDRHVDALVVNTEGEAEQLEVYADLARGGFPIVQLLDSTLAGAGITSVVEDMRASGYLATRRLIETGRCHIALLTHERHMLNRDAREQQEGYEQALAEAGLAPHVIAHSLARFEFGDTHSWYRCVDEVADAIFDPKNRPDGLVCYSSVQAVRVAELALDRGVSVPEQLALIGQHDHPICRIARPAITTMRPDFYALGVAAARAVLELLDGEKAENRRISPTLVARVSA